MKKLFIIDTIADDKSIAHMGHLEKILGEKLVEYHLRDVHLATEELDEEGLKESQAVIFSGSMRSVYEDFPWKKKMHKAFDLILERKIPTLAVCFGAQFLAHHLGTRVIKNPRGVEFGPVKISLTEEGRAHDLIGDYDGDKHVFATHQDIVERLPQGATLLAYNDNSPIQAYQYGSVLATQFHSDIPTERARKLLEARRERYLTSGFLRDEKHYEELMSQLHLGEESHDILKRFLAKV